MSVFSMYMVCISVLCVCIFLKICMYVHVYVCMCQYRLAYGFRGKKYIHIHTNKYTYIHKNSIKHSMCIYEHVFWTNTYNTYIIQSNKTFKKNSVHIWYVSVCICMYLYLLFVWGMYFHVLWAALLGVCLSLFLLSLFFCRMCWIQVAASEVSYTAKLRVNFFIFFIFHLWAA